MSKLIITNNTRTTLSDIFKSRYVIYQFAKRDFTIRYKASFLGYLWAVINPFFQAMIYITVFGLLVRVQTPEYATSYAVVLLLGLLVWTLFNQAADQVSNTLINNMHILKKVYFPRINLCIAAIATATMDFFIAFLVTLVILLVWKFQNVSLMPSLLLFPLLVVGVILLALSLGAVLAILKVKYQDFKHLVPMIFQTLFFLSPIVYTQSLVADEYLFLYKLNPLYGYISTFRWMFIDNSPVELGYFFYSLTFSIILFLFTMFFFSKQERDIVDSE